MTGEQLKIKLVALDSSLAKTARRLGMTPQNLNVMLKTKDIKSGVIERLAEIYKKPISYFYDGGNQSVHAEGDFSAAAIHGDASVTVSRDKYLEALLEEKDKRIALLESILKSNKQI